MDFAALRHHKGSFFIPDSFLKTDIETVMLIMAHVLVIRAEHMLDRGGIEYIAFSPLFEQCGYGVETPDYQFDARFDWWGNLTELVATKIGGHND